MKTRYEILDKAGDLLDSARKLLCDASEPDLANEVHKILKQAYAAQDAAWRPENAEPELENA